MFLGSRLSPSPVHRDRFFAPFGGKIKNDCINDWFVDLAPRQTAWRKSKEKSKQQNLKNYMQARERDRTIFLAGIVVWYILNVFEAYVEGTLKTFDVSDDLSIIFQEPDNPPKKATNNVSPATGVSLNISLQAKNKDENRSDWIW